jgi:4-amino-4-deoxy-L-arabinose transferase-like glycosyltransferase
VTTASIETPARRSGLRSIPLPILLLGLLILARLALAGWWLATDSGVLDTESGRHVQRAWDGFNAMRNGDALWFFGDGTEYPPLLYVIASAGAVLGGLHVDALVAAQDVFAIPALGLGCYGAASVAYGRIAGLVAAVVALGMPIMGSVFHMFLIDTTQAAAAALALWGILACDRFSRVGVSALAGAAVGLGMLSKQNFPLFVAGPLLVIFLRGGWRHWRGLLVFAAVAALLTATWYWSEIARTVSLVHGASGEPAGSAAAGAATPLRWTAKNLAWYAWSFFDVAVLLPLMLVVVAGGVALSLRFLRRPAKHDYTPELMAGVLVSYAALTWIQLKDPRYALPMLPYFAVLAGGGVALMRGRARVAAMAFIGLFALVNVLGAATGTGERVRIDLPGATDVNKRHIGIYSPGGWVSGPPDASGAVLAVMRAAKAAGIEKIAFDPGAQQAHFNHPGLDIVSREAGIPIAYPFDPANPRHAMLSNHFPPLADPPPCGITDDGTGIYLSHSPVEVPYEQREFFCPSR